MAENIVSSLFGPSPWQVQQQLQQQQMAEDMQMAKMNAFERGRIAQRQGLRGLFEGVTGYEDPAIAEAKRRQAAVSGLSADVMLSPDKLREYANTIQDPKMRLTLALRAQEMDAELKKQKQNEARMLLDEARARQSDAMAAKLALTPQQGKKLSSMAQELVDSGLVLGSPEFASAMKKRIAAEDFRKGMGDSSGGRQKAPSGYMWNATGDSLVPIPGGPADKKESGKLSATQEKELFEADEKALGAKSAAELIAQAKLINDKAMGGWGSGALTTAGSALPSAIRPKSVDYTLELENIVQNSVLPQLKAIFGAAPTEGERKILLDVAGSVNQPAEVRKGIFDRAEKAAKARAEFNEKKASAIRGGTYTKPAGMGVETQATSSQGGWAIRPKGQ